MQIDNYHEKRATNRRQQDGKFEFLMTQVKLAIRMVSRQDIDEILRNAVDTIEKGEKI